MATRNNASSLYGNQRNRYSLSVSDTNEHDLPDTDGDDGTAGNGFNIGSADIIEATVINNQNQDLTARLEATGPRDANSFSEPNKLVENVTVGSGGGVESLLWSIQNDGSYSQLRVVFSFTQSPSGNNDTVVEFRKAQ